MISAATADAAKAAPIKSIIDFNQLGLELVVSEWAA